MAKTSPTTRSIELMRERGWIVTKVEQIIPMPGRPFPRRKDAFGFGDLLAAHPERKIVALVQVTTTGAFNDHVEKIRGYTTDKRDPKNEQKAYECNLNAHTWIDAGGRIFVHGWALRGPRGQVKRWTLRAGEMVNDPRFGLMCQEKGTNERENRKAPAGHVRRDRPCSVSPRRRAKVRQPHAR